MSLEKAEKYLEEKGFLDHVIELEASTATVTEAAEALQVEPGMIAKTMSFLQNDKAVLILTEGTARVDNRKYKDTFHTKAKMIPFDEVENIIGHAPGGVCPFGINEGIEVYLDESLKQFTTVYPAAGNDHSAVKLTIPNWNRYQRQTDGWMCVKKQKTDRSWYDMENGGQMNGYCNQRISDRRRNSSHYNMESGSRGRCSISAGREPDRRNRRCFFQRTDLYRNRSKH